MNSSPKSTSTRSQALRLQRGSRRALVTVVIALFSASASAVETNDEQARSIVDQTLLEHGLGRPQLDPGVVVAWNELAYEIALAEDQFLTFKGHRAFSMMHLAMHDALNSIVPVYSCYAYTGSRAVAHPIAAAAQAAYDVLVSQYPSAQQRLGEQLAAWLARVPDSPLEKRGIELGKATAAAILAVRAGDRFDFPGTYQFRSGPGQYQTTPPWNGFVAQPGFRFAKPFALEYQHQFRPPPPPPLENAAYTRAFREAKDFGALASQVRTPDQTGYAIWWMEFAEGSVNRLARQLVAERGTHLWAASRMFAWLNMALFDGYIATWDSKYEYNHWRPYTAIREAQADGNPDTTPDTGWEPLSPTPPFPEYASAHSVACAASFGVLRRTFGDEVAFTMATTTAPSDMPTRSFTSFTAAASECADSRVRLGWHFRYATDAGLALGRQVGRYIIRTTLRGDCGHPRVASEQSMGGTEQQGCRP